MAIDIARVARAALEAATQDSSPPMVSHKRSRLPVGRAVLVGAGLVTVGRLVAGSRGREVFGSLQERISAFGHEDSDGADEDVDGEEYDDEPEGEGDDDFDEEEFDDEPEGESDDDFDEEDFDDEPEGESDDDFDEEEYDDEPEGESDDDFDKEEYDDEPEGESDDDFDEADEEEEPEEEPSPPRRPRRPRSRGQQEPGARTRKSTRSKSRTRG